MMVKKTLQRTVRAMFPKRSPGILLNQNSRGAEHQGRANKANLKGT